MVPGITGFFLSPLHYFPGSYQEMDSIFAHTKKIGATFFRSTTGKGSANSGSTPNFSLPRIYLSEFCSSPKITRRKNSVSFLLSNGSFPIGVGKRGGYENYFFINLSPVGYPIIEASV
jgi:hypothetical protein